MSKADCTCSAVSQEKPSVSRADCSDRKVLFTVYSLSTTFAQTVRESSIVSLVTFIVKKWEEHLERSKTVVIQIQTRQLEARALRREAEDVDRAAVDQQDKGLRKNSRPRKSQLRTRRLSPSLTWLKWMT